MCFTFIVLCTNPYGQQFHFSFTWNTKVSSKYGLHVFFLCFDCKYLLSSGIKCNLQTKHNYNTHNNFPNTVTSRMDRNCSQYQWSSRVNSSLSVETPGVFQWMVRSAVRTRDVLCALRAIGSRLGLGCFCKGLVLLRPSHSNLKYNEETLNQSKKEYCRWQR